MTACLTPDASGRSRSTVSYREMSAFSGRLSCCGHCGGATATACASEASDQVSASEGCPGSGGGK
eukprot:1166555-Pleurochrysis_carterae.AAC.2